jgi:hypothetical protein
LPVIATGIKDPTAEDCLSDNFTPKEFSRSSIIKGSKIMSYYCISIDALLPATIVQIEP